VVAATWLHWFVCPWLKDHHGRLLVDSGSEHPHLSTTRVAKPLGIVGQVVGTATQANGDVLPLSDIGNLELYINSLPTKEPFLSALLSHYDIIFGKSWLHHHRGIVDYVHDQLWQLLPSGLVPLHCDTLPLRETRCPCLQPSHTSHILNPLKCDLATMVTEGCRVG